MVVLAGWTAGAEAAFEIRYERGLELSRSREGQLHPVSVTCDPLSGEICVTESANASLHIFNAAGVEIFRTGGFAGLTLPSDGTVDAEGRLVVATMASAGPGTIVRLNTYGEPDGYQAEPAAAEWNPEHLLITRDGHYLTVDSTAALLAKHDAVTGALLWTRTLGDAGTLDKSIGRPIQLADGTFRIPGGETHRVLTVTEDGTLTDAFGRFGTAAGRFVTPVAVAAGPQGSLLVLDRMRHKVMVFDAANKFITEYGSIGDAPGRFYHPVSMATDGEGRLYVAQGFRGRVQVFNVLADGAGE
jgi:DNA-binding beta-propeller fold protein YncE